MKPVIYLFGSPIPTYLLVLSLTYSFLLIYLIRRARARGYDPSMTLDLALAIMVGGFVGARLLHVVFEKPQFYSENPWAVLQFWRGGFVFYGGALGAWLASEWVLWRNSLDRSHWQDLFAPIFPLGYAFGRLGCLSAGCCFGQEAVLPWAVIFPYGVEAPGGIPLHPTQLYAFAWEFLLFIGLLVLERFCQRRPGFLFWLWLFFHAVGRLLMEAFRADDRGGLVMGMSISSLISYLLILISAAVLITKSKGRANVPGTP